jgi:hypothetical protein
VSALTVAERFCGPPGIANGGCPAGRLATLVGAPTVSGRLRRPTPLDRQLEVAAVTAANHAPVPRLLRLRTGPHTG